MDKDLEKKKKGFTKKLLQWYAQSHRPMPWKEEKNPYLVWLSEIILQQTRVEQGWPYFEKFRDKYPKIENLANAPEDEVMKLWEGLGYYSRARNLHFTAKEVTEKYQGVFPNQYQDILALKGIGPYTAAAIASFAYDLPYAVVDGNVYRVLSRFFGISTPIDSTEGKHQFSQLATELLDQKNPAKYNQAIIDFGATHCLPKLPKCTTCNLKSSCAAFKSSKTNEFPVKAKKIKKRTRYFQYLVMECPAGVIIQKRLEKDIWQNLYEFPLIETTGDLSVEEVLDTPLLTDLLDKREILPQYPSKPFQQLLTHQKIIAVFWEIKLKTTPKLNKESSMMIERKNLDKFAFPKIIDRYLRDNSLYLKMF